MQTTDRTRIFRSLGLALVALLLVGGAVFANNAITGGKHDTNNSGPSASAEASGDHGVNDVSKSPEASESPEASSDDGINHDLNDDNANDGIEASGAGTPLGHESESPEAGASEGPDDNGGSSGHGGDDSNAS